MRDLDVLTSLERQAYEKFLRINDSFPGSWISARSIGFPLHLDRLVGKGYLDRRQKRGPRGRVRSYYRMPS